MSAIPSNTNENPTHCASVRDSNTGIAGQSSRS
jgi:hypothetical protein